MCERKVCVSGRTLWLGGTEVSKKREASQFNCAHTHVETVYDIVDCLWLLLQGCGVGFTPITGSLNGFAKPIKNIEVIRSTRTSKGGLEDNEEIWDSATRTWTIRVGDSAEAWAKSIGKLLAGKFAADKLIFDFSNIRPAGERLKGYGWISSGDESISKAYAAIFEIFNRRAGSLLSRIDILDVINWLGTVLSSRRSAEIALFEYGEDEWAEFAVAKKEFWNGIQRSCDLRQRSFRRGSRGRC
jgi:ribonucleoside-triphosphate reductase